MSQVSILRTERYEPALLDATVEEHFSLAGIEAQIQPGARVVLKPNLLMKRAPEGATTTHPELVAAVARWLKARGVENIVLADSPGGPYTRALLTSIYRTTGMAAVAEREGIALNTDVAWIEKRGGQQVSAFNIITPVAEADFIINLCKLKTHCMTGLSGAVKNLFGCVPGLQKPELHYRFKDPDLFCSMLCELCETVRPGITLVDAVEAMEGDGPSGGNPRHLGLTLCATNPYDLDEILCELIGMPPMLAGTVKAARARGLATARADILVKGEASLLSSVQGFQMPRSKPVDMNTRLPRFLRGLVDRLAVPRPVVRAADCVGCGKCAESCPAHIISMHTGKAVIDYRACVKCYCCHEMCPVKAIEVRSNRLFHL